MDEVSAAQAATLTGLSERTIRRRIAAGSIPARKIGPNRFAIRRDDLPVIYPFQALAQRIDELEQRVAAIERREAHMSAQVTSLASAPETVAAPALAVADPASKPSPTPAHPTADSAAATDIRQALAQLAYEANRLAQAIPTTAWSQSAVGQLALVGDASADGEDTAHDAQRDRAANSKRAPRRGSFVGKRRDKAAQS